MSTKQWIFNEAEGKWFDQWNDLFDDDPMVISDGSSPCTVAELILDMCGCASDRIAEWVFIHLADAKDDKYPQIRNEAEFVIAAIADQAGLTEHGSSIYGSWITPAGYRWMYLQARDADVVQ